MNDAELERLASLWRQADPAEQAMFEKVARKARLKARLIGYGDSAMFAVLLIVLPLVVIRHWSVTSFTICLVILAIIVWGNWRRRLYREQSARIDTSRREAFLDSSIEGARARLRTVLFGLYMAIPLLLLTMLLLISSKLGVGLGPAIARLPETLASKRGLIVASFFLLPLIWSILARRRVAAEIERLEALKRDYEAEGRLDEPS